MLHRLLKFIKKQVEYVVAFLYVKLQGICEDLHDNLEQFFSDIEIQLGSLSL